MNLLTLGLLMKMVRTLYECEYVLQLLYVQFFLYRVYISPIPKVFPFQFHPFPKYVMYISFLRRKFPFFNKGDLLIPTFPKALQRLRAL